MAKLSGLSLPNRVQLENESPTQGTLGGGTGMRAGNPTPGVTNKIEAGRLPEPIRVYGGTDGPKQVQEKEEKVAPAPAPVEEEKGPALLTDQPTGYMGTTPTSFNNYGNNSRKRR